MHHFTYRGDDLYCEDLPVRRMADEVGTPVYIYSHAMLAQQFRLYDEAFAGVPHLICYAMKASANLAILRLFAKMGGGADVVSGGELFRALRAGLAPDKIVFAGIGKSREEMAEALRANILMFNVESSQELRALNAVAGSLGVRACVALRINPDVDPKTHPYIATGFQKSKFGIDIALARTEYEAAKALPHLEVVGVHQHIGSQITELTPFVDSLTKTVQLVRDLRARGLGLRYLDIGGGLGIRYDEEDPPLPRAFADALGAIIRDLGCTVVMEPGRFLVGNAGILVTRVLYVKQTPIKTFIIVDAGMNDLIRPSLYGAFHGIQPVRRVPGAPEVTADVVGPICESGDFLAKDRPVPRVAPGDLLAVMSAGAYGYSMASNYNARPRPPEVLARGEKSFVVRRRESYEDLIRGEEIPAEV